MADPIAYPAGLLNASHPPCFPAVAYNHTSNVSAPKPTSTLPPPSYDFPETGGGTIRNMAWEIASNAAAPLERAADRPGGGIMGAVNKVTGAAKDAAGKVRGYPGGWRTAPGDCVRACACGRRVRSVHVERLLAASPMRMGLHHAPCTNKQPVHTTNPKIM